MLQPITGLETYIQLTPDQALAALAALRTAPNLYDAYQVVSLTLRPYTRKGRTGVQYNSRSRIKHMLSISERTYWRFWSRGRDYIVDYILDQIFRGQEKADANARV